MFAKKLELNGFRNYDQEKIEFSPNLNLIVGKNAQGKTNLIEAIYYSAVGKSARAKKDVDLINWSKDKANFKLTVQKTAGTKDIEIGFFRNQKKAIKVNGVNLLKIGDLLGVVNVIYFSPDELKLVKDAPEDRRKFMDTDISQFNKTYFYSLLRYNKILDQRNKLLKEKYDAKTIEQTLPIWDAQLVAEGAKLIKQRIEFIERLKKYVKNAHSYLTSQEENLQIEYAGIVGETEQEIKEKLEKELTRVREKDLKLGYTNVGPHRDDIKFLVNDIDIRNFGSQGQHRTVALSLKLAELEIFKEETGEYPILLLDDVLSELDQDRQQRLLSKIKTIQSFITTAQYDPFMFENAKIIKIENGKIVWLYKINMSIGQKRYWHIFVFYL